MYKKQLEAKLEIAAIEVAAGSYKHTTGHFPYENQMKKSYIKIYEHPIN